MSQAQARAWWADVEHLRDAAERRIAARERRVAEREGATRSSLLRDEVLSDDWQSAAARHFDEVAGPTPRERRGLIALAPPEPEEFEGYAERDEPALQPPEAPPTAVPSRRFPRRDEPRFVRRSEARGRRGEPRRAAPGAVDHAAGALARRPAHPETDEHRRTRAHAGAPASLRRTVEIRGQVTPPRTATARALDGDDAIPAVSRPRRPRPRLSDLLVGRPDRLAMWAVLLGVILVIVAAASAHG